MPRKVGGAEGAVDAVGSSGAAAATATAAGTRVLGGSAASVSSARAAVRAWARKPLPGYSRVSHV